MRKQARPNPTRSEKARSKHAVAVGWVVVCLSAAIAQAAPQEPAATASSALKSAAAPAKPSAPTVESLIETERTVLDQPFSYPSGAAKITAQIISLGPGASTSKHVHGVPMFAYILKGDLIVDYGPEGERRYRKGDSLVEAIDWPHRGRNGGKGKVEILVVFAGADGVSNSVTLPD